MGLEVDYLAGREAAIAATVGRLDWDFLLGSVHWVAGLAVDWERASIWERYPVDQVWSMYVDDLCAAAASGIYDAMAHPDLAKVFGHRPDPKPVALYEQIADAFAAAGVCAEVSTAGFGRPLGELYPDPDLLALLHRRERAGDAGVGRSPPRRRRRARSTARWPCCARSATARSPCSIAAIGGRWRSMADELRVGIGFDAHAFADGRRLVLAGVEVPHARGLAGHSDADLIAHAVTDALLGAAGGGDIGSLFPSEDLRLEGASSIALLRDAWTALPGRAGGSSTSTRW